MLPADIQHSLLLLSDRKTEGERKASSLDSTLSSSTAGNKTEAEATSKLPKLCPLLSRLKSFVFFKDIVQFMNSVEMLQASELKELNHSCH